MTYANVASTTALVLAIGGGGAAVAAAMVPANSVGSKQIVNNSVKSADLKNDGVTGTDVKESTLGQVPSAASASGLSAGAISSPDAFGSGKLGVVRAYAWNNSASADAALTNNGYTYNRSGGAVNVVHNSAGNYTVTFDGLNLNGGNVVVSGYGGGANWCKVSSWGSSSIGVLCFNSAGTATDSLWTIAVTE
jgi:hypothetical protein